MTEDKEINICLSSCYYLKLSLMWPFKRDDSNPKWFYYRLIIFVIESTFTFLFSVTMYILKSMEEGTTDISESLALLAAMLGLMIMMVLYVIKQKDLSLLLQDLSNFRKFGKPTNFEQVNKRLNYCVQFVFWYAIFGAAVYSLIRINDIPNCQSSRKIREVCGVFMPLWTPFDADYWPVLTFIIAHAIFFVVILDKVTLLVSLQVLEIAWNIKLRINQLNVMILNCFDENLETSRKRLNECIQYHIDIIDYCERFNNCFTNGMFTHLATTGVIIGCLANEIVKNPHPGAVLHIFGWIISLFVSCLGGQTLIDSSTSVANAVYNSKWYYADVKLRKDLILMIERSQKPLFVATGAFNVMSLSLFVTVMKMSYSFFTLLSKKQ